MKPAFWMTAIFFGVCSGLPALRAGDIYFLDNRPAVHGKLSLDTNVIRVDAGGEPDVKLSDVLEADFDDADFHLDYFSSRESPAKLPPSWQGQDIGQPSSPGSYTYADGTLTITTGAGEIVANSDKCYFLGQPWTDSDGQWTMRIKDRSAEAWRVGLMLRVSLDPDAPTFQFCAEGDHGFRSSRAKAGGFPGYDSRFAAPVPGWIRLTRHFGYLMDVETSGDGKSWDFTEQNGDMYPNGVNSFTSTLAGIFVQGNSPTTPGKAVLDDITFEPLPALSDILPNGILLTDGTYLVGTMNHLDPTQGAGTIGRHDKQLTISYAQVADVIWRSVARRKVWEQAGHVGMIMRNGDFLAADFMGIDDSGIHFSSMQLGPFNYAPWDTLMRVGVLHPLQAQASDYEIRLKDGSDIRAGGVTVDKDQIAIQDVSGLSVPAGQDEIAQLWAGPARLQKLIELPWKATAPVSNPAPAPPAAAPAPAARAAAPAPAPAPPAAVPAPAPAAPAATPAPAPAPAPALAQFLPPLPPLPPLPAVRCWEGNNAEQIMAVSSGTVINFPLNGKFQTVAVRIAILSNTPNAKAVVQILADGREAARTPPISVGDPPSLVQATITDPQTVSFNAEASSPDVKILYLDPVVIRD